jgi:nucleoid DNA-binding protein
MPESNQISYESIIAEIAHISGVKKDTVREVMSASVDIITTAVLMGKKVHIPGLGTFFTIIKKERVSHNAYTRGQTYEPEVTFPKFRYAQNFKKSVISIKPERKV